MAIRVCMNCETTQLGKQSGGDSVIPQSMWKLCEINPIVAVSCVTFQADPNIRAINLSY